jgi:hypothetical protein
MFLIKITMLKYCLKERPRHENQRRSGDVCGFSGLPHSGHTEDVGNNQVNRIPVQGNWKN